MFISSLPVCVRLFCGSGSGIFDVVEGYYGSNSVRPSEPYMAYYVLPDALCFKDT